MTTIAQARDDISKTFHDAWIADNNSSGIKVFYDNLDEDSSSKDSKKSWVRFSIRHFDTFSTESLSGGNGQKKYFRDGVVIVGIFNPVENGMTLNSTLVDIAMTAFEGKATANGVWFRNVRFTEIGTTQSWFQTNVKADFSYSEIK